MALKDKNEVDRLYVYLLEGVQGNKRLYCVASWKLSYETEPTANYLTSMWCSFMYVFVCNTQVLCEETNEWKKNGLCQQRTPSRWEWCIPVLQQHSATEIWMDDAKKKEWELANDLRTEKELQPYKSCPRFFCKVWDNTLLFLLILCGCCVYESGVYECMCLKMYCMSLRGLWAQQSLNSGVDVSTSSNEGLQIGLAVDEAHGVKLVQLGLEPHFWGLGLKREETM